MGQRCTSGCAKAFKDDDDMRRSRKNRSRHSRGGTEKRGSTYILSGTMDEMTLREAIPTKNTKPKPSI